VKLFEVARYVEGVLYGKKNFTLEDIQPPDEATKNDLTFLFDISTKTNAGAVIANKKIKGKNGIIVEDPREAMFLLLEKLRAISNKKRPKEISSRAIIEDNVILPKSCVIEPFAIIKSGVKIGNDTYIGATCVIDRDVSIGRNCEIHPHTVIYKNTKIGNYVSIQSNTVIGKQGFGYLKKKGYKRFQHIGGVVIDDFVEIGGNVTIDRGTIGHTIIGRGTKIDNLVHIAHNVKIGTDCIIMGQVGIAGSTTIADNVVLCGQVGVKDHITISKGVTVYAKSGVFTPLTSNEVYSGIPARQHRAVLKALARLYKNL
jgi:UDP-3-O-[3-hydroxymyristoyl] glucosamine N-acyltransferase